MATKKVDILADYSVRKELEKLIENNIEDIPYEGKEIDVEGIINDLYFYFKENHFSILKHTKNTK